MPAANDLKALLIAPIAPSNTGNGLAMRIGVTVHGLSQVCNLTVALVPVLDPNANDDSLTWTRQFSDECFFIQLPDERTAILNWLSNTRNRKVFENLLPLPTVSRCACPNTVMSRFEDQSFDLVWTTRLCLAGVANPFAETGARLILDIDEDDARTMRSIAALHRDRGSSEAAKNLESEARAMESFARFYLKRFDLIVTASDIETRSLKRLHELESVITVPNAIQIPSGKEPSRRTDPPAKFLFVGNMDYPPNLDAAERLASEILPRIRAALPNTELHLVGSGGNLHHLTRYPGVNIHGFVDDLGPLYASCLATIVPLRAGGGSRLKILEAFARGLPVIASTFAASGLEITDKEHYLRADTDLDIISAATKILVKSI